MNTSTVAGGRNVALARAGEEVEILRRPGREVLCRQRGTTDEKEAPGRGQLEEHCRHLQLEVGERRGVVGIAH